MQTGLLCAFPLGIVVVVSSVGCGGPAYRRDFLGRGSATISANTDGSQPAVVVGAAPGAGGIAVKAGDELEVVWTIAQPRAERLQYALVCPGDEMTLVEAGETFEQYRERRLAQLRAARDRDRQVVSSVASALVPGLSAGGRVETPTGSGTADVGVDRRAVGDAVAANVVSDDVMLPPGDVGAGTLTGKARVNVRADGACNMTIYSATPGVTGALSITRVTNLRRERDKANAARRDAALAVRGSIEASLVARGADPGARARAQAHALAAAEAERVRVEAQRERLRVQAAVRLQAAETEAHAVRGYFVRYLVGTCHADPHAREKARDREQERLRIAIDLRARLRAQLIGLGADPNLRVRLAMQARERAAAQEARAEAAARARAEAEARAAAEAAAIAAAADAAERDARATRQAMVDYLVLLGARLRPPMPPVRPEDPGDAPFDGAVWIAGRWIWNIGAWTWEAGGWRDRRGFQRDTVVDNEPRGWTTRDHRSEAGSGSGSGSIYLPPSSNSGGGGVTVRDHRGDSGKRDEPSIKVRDHRRDKDDDKKDDDKDKDDDSKVKVRDHRR